MDNLRVGKPSTAELSKLGPGHPVCSLRPASQNFQPDFLDRDPKLVQSRRVQWNCVVIAPPLIDTRQPGADFRQIPMHHSFQLVLEFFVHAPPGLKNWPEASFHHQHRQG